MVEKFFDKKTGSGLTSKTRKHVNEVLAQELHKSVMMFKDNVQAADLAEMTSLSSQNGVVKYLLCVIDVFTEHALVRTWKDKKFKTVLNDTTEIVKKFKLQPNKLWVDQGKEFYNNFMQKWLDDYSVVAENFIRTVKIISIKNDS